MQRIVEPQKIKNISLLPTQESMYLYQQQHPEGNAFKRSVAVEIKGHVNLALFRDAIEYVTQRHAILTTKIFRDPHKGVSLQTSPDLSFSEEWPLQVFTINDLSSPTPPLEDLQTTFKQLNKESFFDNAFNLEEGPLWRAAILDYQNGTYHFTMLFHHMIIDAFSISNILLQEISWKYNNEIDKLTSIPPIEKFNFRLTPQEEEKRTDYWKKKLSGLGLIELPTDSHKPTRFDFEGNRMPFHISAELTGKLESLNKAYSFNTILLAVLYIVLARYTNQTDISLGITSANRRHAGIPDEEMKKLVGCFFNTLALRINFNDSDITIEQVLNAVKTNVSEALKNQLPADIVEERAIEPNTRKTQHAALPFDIALVVYDKQPTLTLSNTTASAPKEIYESGSKFYYFGISLEKDKECNGSIEYSNVFTKKTIERFQAHVNQAAEYIATHALNTKISSIPLLLKNEIELINKYNQTDNPCTYKGFVPDYFHEQAKRIPDGVFAAFHDEELIKHEMTYEKADRLSTQLARYIIDKLALGKEDNIGICLTRSIHSFFAFLAVLKTGNAFAPVENAKSEKAKILHKLKAANMQVVIVDNETEKLLAQLAPHIKCINIENEKTLAVIQTYDKNYNDLSRKISADSAAYIISTSASSGKIPKEVVITHEGFMNLLWALIHTELPNHTQVIGTAYDTFDAFYFDFLVAIAKGGSVHIIAQKICRAPNVLTRIINENKINFGAFLPQILRSLKPKEVPTLDYVVSMGEAPREDTLSLWPNIGNGYGPTEGTICISIEKYLLGNHPRNIGKPIANMKMFIVSKINDEYYGVNPIGVPGEIFIAGPGLAQGYFNDEKNNQDFISGILDPDTLFIKICDKHTPNAIRFYKTGDLASYRLSSNGEDLTITFKGRIGSHVKINGTRVSLPNIEAAILADNDIEQAAVIPDAECKFLIAYVVTKKIEISSADLKKKIASCLVLFPPVAIPRSIVTLSEMPLTDNHKLNLHDLPPPPLIIANNKPQNKLQAILQKVWANVLRYSPEEIDITSTLKELEANSIFLPSLVTQLNEELQPFLLKPIVMVEHTFVSIANPDQNQPALMKIIPKLILHTEITIEEFDKYLCTNGYIDMAALANGKSEEKINNGFEAVAAPFLLNFSLFGGEAQTSAPNEFIIGEKSSNSHVFLIGEEMDTSGNNLDTDTCRP